MDKFYNLVTAGLDQPSPNPSPVYSTCIFSILTHQTTKQLKQNRNLRVASGNCQPNLAGFHEIVLFIIVMFDCWVLRRKCKSFNYFFFFKLIIINKLIFLFKEKYEKKLLNFSPQIPLCFFIVCLWLLCVLALFSQLLLFTMPHSSLYVNSGLCNMAISVFFSFWPAQYYSINQSSWILFFEKSVLL